MRFFPEAEELEWGPQFFMICVYGYILFTASKTISDGSELLLNIFGPGIVGGLLIPILGAVPDGMIILLSGMGPGTPEEIQEQLAVGVGTLAGSTIMLLTIPWGIGVFLNQREMDPETGKAAKHWVTPANGGPAVLRPKIPTKFSLNNCATTLRNTPKLARIMILCSFTYLIVQIPALFLADTEAGQVTERWFALVGFVVSVVVFFAYLAFQFFDKDANDFTRRKQHMVTGFTTWLKSYELQYRFEKMGGTIDKVFHALDKDNDGYLDLRETRHGLLSLGLKVSDEDARTYFNMMDKNNDNRVSLVEFERFVANFLPHFLAKNAERNLGSGHSRTPSSMNEVYKKLEDPGDPPAHVLKQLTAWYNDPEQTDIVLELATKERHQVHMWANKKETPPVFHSSEDLPGADPTANPKAVGTVRKLKLTKMGLGSRKKSIITLERRAPVNPNLPKWANASDALASFATNNGTYEQLFSSLDTDKTGELTFEQVRSACEKYNLTLTDQALEYLFHTFDKDKKRTLDTDEFRAFLEHFVTMPTNNLGGGESKTDASKYKSYHSINMPAPDEKTALLTHKEDEDEEEEEEEEEEEDEEFRDWSVQKKKYYALWLLALGTVMVTIFSDPMVETLNAFSKNVGISAFYVSFVITPLASNASEVIAGLIFAAKRTNAGMALTMSSLYGASCMNSTFCLAIFLALVYFRELKWNYAAEVSAILLVIWIVGYIGRKETVTIAQAIFVLLLFPLSMVYVWFMENIMGIP